MSKIDKLSILGVRSFDNTRSETIQFQTPLTLIVGYNGSGKTTIIECLKYATTGELPPNSSRGGAFIHDPKLCGEKEVLAQVKLSFKSTSGAKMVATRSLQLTVKKTTRSQKTLEGQLLMIKDGERTAISSRVAELDQIMPQYLGVSKAILESVIFCHQDDSLWPMSEPSVLKKRFDEIFEALKYTKAIDNIKILRKKQNEELAKYKIYEQHAKDAKDKGDKAEKRSTELADEIEELRGEAQGLEKKIKEVSTKSQDAWDHAAKFEKIVARLEGKRIEAQALQRNVQELRSNLKEMTDSDEELQSILDRYEERVTLYREERETQRLRYGEFTQEIEGQRRILGSKQSEVGKFEAQKDHYERQLQHRENLIKETARRHSIRGFDIEVTEDQVRIFMERIGKMARDQHAAFEKSRRETQEKLRHAQEALNHLNERKSALNQSKESYKSQMFVNDKKITNHQSQLDDIDIDEGGKAVLEIAIEDVEKRLSNAKKEFVAADYDTKVQDMEQQSRELDSRNDQLNAELIEGTKQASDVARLDFLHKELSDRQRSLETMVGAHGSHISRVVGDWTPSTLERGFQASLNQKAGEVKDAERQRDGVNREMEQVEFKLKSAKSDLKNKRLERDECEKIVREATDEEPADYLEALQTMEGNMSIMKDDKGGFKAQEQYFSECLKTAEEHSLCRLCQRPLRDKEKGAFMTRLKRNIEMAVRNAIIEDAQDLEEDLQRANEARPSYDTWLRLSKKEIPTLESETQSLEARYDVLVTDLEQQDHVVNERQELKRDVESFTKTVQNIVKYHTEILSFKNQVQELSAKQRDSGGSRGLEAIREDLRKITEQSKSVKSQLTHCSTDRERARGHINTLELESRDTKSKLDIAAYQLKERSTLTSQIDELKAHITEGRESLRQLDKDIQSLVPQIAQAQAKCDDISQRGADRDRELQEEASKLSDSVHQLKLADQDINAYLDRGGPEQLRRTHREMESLVGEIEKLETEQRQITVEVKKIEDHLRNTDDTKRSINDNLRYRRSSRDLESVRSEISGLESQNAEVDKARYEREASKWQMERNKLTAEQASIIGTLKSKDDQLAELIQDWETDYKDAAYKYKEAHIKVETTKAAVEDLGRYGSALDKAIMKYHSVKMEEINRIIEELWKKTYQGTDVDTILIRSDNENVKGNKSYNYRVVMVKQDAEMDMRGRCSAGQKVLASIIIRLALAECFGVNCGLIALDEPTTNLDRDNIRALAEALAEIIRVRRQQSNFQLIVITHDEDFLRYMQCADFCDNYYRISRNERQKSIIERQSIAEVV